MSNNNEKEMKHNNVVMFPNVERLLIDRAYTCLEEKRFLDALPLFEEAKAIDPMNERVLIGILVTYIEAGRFEEAKTQAELLLKKGIGEYFQIIDLYLMVLVQLEVYDEVEHVIETLLEEPSIPQENRIHLMGILHENKKMATIHSLKMEADRNEEHLQVAQILNESNDENAQLLLMNSLTGKNIRPYLKEVKIYLESETSHPFIQTMLLHELKEQEVMDEVIVHKFGMSEKVIPAQLQDIQQDPLSIQMMDILSEALENEDPTFFENIKTLANRNIFLLFPLRVPEASPSVWAAAFHLLMLQYVGMEDRKEEIVDTYRVSMTEVEDLLVFIQRMEQTSHPNI